MVVGTLYSERPGNVVGGLCYMVVLIFVDLISILQFSLLTYLC